MTFTLHKHQISRIVDRVPFICEMIRGQSVLDVGCGSWPNTQELRAIGALPHDAYALASNSIIGVESQYAAWNFLYDNAIENALTYEWLDFQEESFEYCSAEVDWVILGEVLEHMAQPGLALEHIRYSVVDNAKLIATAPNAFCYAAYQRACNDEEQVHEEHVAWYSPATLRQLLERHGWKVNELLGYCPGGKLPEGCTMTQAQGIIAVCEKG